MLSCNATMVVPPVQVLETVSVLVPPAICCTVPLPEMASAKPTASKRSITRLAGLATAPRFRAAGAAGAAGATCALGLRITEPHRLRSLAPLLRDPDERTCASRPTWMHAVMSAAHAGCATTRTHPSVKESLQAPSMATQLAAMGYGVVASTPAELEAYIQSESAKLAVLVKAASISLD